MAETKTKNIKIKLDQLLRIKTDLEDSIRKDENSMRKVNSRPKGEEDQIDFKETKRLYELKLEQLIEVKLVIAEANSRGNNDNNKNIYALSNLNRRKAFLNSLNTFEGDRPTLKSAGKNIYFEAKLSYKKVEKELKEIEGRIRELETMLSDFNHKIEVTVELYSELNLV
jgi:hypothetical protein